jgi:hypothetical protein
VLCALTGDDVNKRSNAAARTLVAMFSVDSLLRSLTINSPVKK